MNIFYAGAEAIAQNFSTISQPIDSTLEDYSPSLVILTTAVAVIALQVLAKCFQKSWGETRREQVGRCALRIPFVKKKYTEDIHKQLVHFQESVSKKWENFAPLITTIPEEGWSVKKLLGLIEHYSEVTSSGLKDKQLSGTIYSKSLDQGYEKASYSKFEEEIDQESIEDNAFYFDYLSKKLKFVFTAAFEQSYLWNSLHGDEFAVGACIDYQVVRMVASMFGAKLQEVMGFVTSGGTESLMLAVRIYRNWGIKNRGHQPGEGVILASKTVHAAILKSKEAYLVNIELIETDETGKIDLKKLREAVKKHGNKVVAIIGSDPNYATGVIDSIEEMAKIAQENGCGMHVDSCLGGFIVDKLENKSSSFLAVPGVTSLSADTHKNGLAAKGSSVLVTKELGEKNLAYYSIYSVPGWSGGVYGTPKDAGSQSCVQSFIALLAMLSIGKKGYQRMAQAIHETTCHLADIIREFDGQLKLIAQPDANVMAFKIDKKWGLQKGAIYAFSHEMAKRGFILNNLSDEKVHFCVTLRFVSDPKALKEFKIAVQESLEATKQLNDELIKDGKKFPGDAGMYCALEAAMTPVKNEMSTGKYVENLLFGELGAKDAIRAYFLAQLDPYNKSNT